MEVILFVVYENASVEMIKCKSKIIKSISKVAVFFCLSLSLSFLY